jgi:hypothetical protein
MSVIRNTNTKIIMRLPDQTDRELVGRAANLNEDQIIELAKLPCGVAAVYQNEWVQPVLCKIDRFEGEEKSYTFTLDDKEFTHNHAEIEESLLDYIMDKELFSAGNKEKLVILKSKVIKSKIETKIKIDLIDYIESDDEKKFDALRVLIFDLLSAKNAIEEAKHCHDIEQWLKRVTNELNPSIKEYSKKQIDMALSLILYEQSLRDASYNDIMCRFVEIYKENGGVCEWVK